MTTCEKLSNGNVRSGLEWSTFILILLKYPCNPYSPPTGLHTIHWELIFCLIHYIQPTENTSPISGPPILQDLRPLLHAYIDIILVCGPIEHTDFYNTTIPTFTTLTFRGCVSNLMGKNLPHQKTPVGKKVWQEKKP